eukprot:CAMPEP_0117070342 /NCGR_PEP_ID=MMETSP0472-20121206/49422_1 /TAXON_ID=693140 ORGANISM="Tiarina fusus, Strain LIS" /NCGR_SAMPLE_ID=MMETSP0472 /ASSEMBLY_ACC=CAM_ASM_000603 /LENGTH=66 /DNA_ID=CAMNT_0004793415 /DNA_START=53 /DNA_END=253 /DNA_ORIENTATION=-
MKSSTKLFIGNLSHKVKNRDLEKIFSKYGKVLNVTIKENREIYGFVEYDDVRDAEDAYDRLNNYDL